MAKQLAALALLANALAWGVSWWPFRTLHHAGIHPLWATALIYATSLLVLLFVWPKAWREFLRSPGLWVLALAAGLANVGFNWAVTVGDVVRVVLLFYLMPGWVVLLAWPLLGEKPTKTGLGCVALALAGVAMIVKAPSAWWPWPSGLADWLAIMAGLFFGLTNIMLRKLKDVDASANMLAMFGGGALTAGLVAMGGAQLDIVNALPSPTSAWVVWIVVLSLMFMLGNLGLQYGAARLSASSTSIVMLSEVIFASVSAIALGAGHMSTALWVGGACIVAASLVSITLRQT